jgi:gliding motility-associated-like protein
MSINYKLFALLLLLAGSVRGQITLRVALDADDVTYRIYMTPSVSYTGRSALISSSQITLSVPHGVGVDKFEVTGISSPIPGMRWILSGRADAPRENPDRDYLFFSFLNNNAPIVLFDLIAGQEVLLFQFKRKGNCTGYVQIMDNTTDEFRTPNSLGVNVGNSLAIVGALGNIYKTNTDAPPTLTITTSATLACAGDTIRLRAVPSTPPASATAAYSYQWLADDKPIGPASASPDLVYVLPNRAVAATIRLRAKLFISGPTICRGQFVTATQSLRVNPKPVAMIRFAGDPCTVLPISLSATAVPGASYGWLRDGQPMPDNTSPELSVAQSGNYALRVSLNGCTATSTTQPILGQTQTERVTLRMPMGKTVVGGTPVVLEPVVSNAASFSWSPGAGLSSDAVLNPVATPSSTTTYTLTARSVNGCPATDTVTIGVIPPLYMPTAFTPNGDGENDVWVIRNTEHHANCTVSIFDRWGQAVFHSPDYTQPWTGQSNGVPVQPGVYQYLIRTPFVQYRGTVMILGL